MKVVGFTIVRNAIKYDYPVCEALLSIAPLCDQIIVAVGDSEDGTLDLIKNILPDKIKIITTVWDDSIRSGGQLLAVETNKAYAAIPEDTDWCIYIQADEIIHEKDYPAIQKAMTDYLNHREIDGLLFKFFNFYGAYEYIADSLSWVQYEARIIRKRSDIFSYGDALGFRKGNNNKLAVIKIDAAIYHYGWVREPKAMQQKSENFHKMWHNDEWVSKNVVKANEFDYNTIDSLTLFEGTHPAVMQNRINRKKWHFEFDFSKKKTKLKYRIRQFIKEKFKIEIGGFRNWKIR